MQISDLFALGMILVAFGAVCWLLARWLLSSMARVLRPAAASGAHLEMALADENQEAMLVIQPGGKISSISPRARQIFELDEKETPNLERMARKIRPGDQFLSLCIAEGQARMMLLGRMVEVSSFRVSLGSAWGIVLTLHYLELASDAGGSSTALGTEKLQIFSELSQAMTGNLDFDSTLQAIQQSVEKLIPTDFLEITVWDQEAEVLIPYRFAGIPGVERKLVLSRQRYSLGEGYSGHIARSQAPLMVGNIKSRTDILPANENEAIPIKSFIGVPLEVEKELIGTLELGSFEEDTYHLEDLSILNLLAGQASVALRNAIRYRAEQRRAAELAGLSQLAQAFSSAHEPKGVFARLVDSIAQLLPVEIVGFLIYNEATHSLEGQEPIHGLPVQIVALYRAPIQPGSAAEQTLLNQDVIITDNASESTEWQNLGLAWLAQAASLRDTVLIPLSSSGRMLGYLQVSNHKDASTTYTQDEMRLLMIVSNQAAPIIENATLMLQSRQRAQRAEGMRRIASLASSSATLDEFLNYSLTELSHLLQAGIGAVFLVDPGRKSLQLHRGSYYGQQPEDGLPEISLPLDDPQFPFTVTGSHHNLVSANLLEEKAIIPHYQQILNELKIVSAIAVPLVVRNEGIGELWFGSTEVNSFDQGELQLVITAAGQLAGVVEQSYLRAQTDESLRRRVEQLTALSRISRELSTSLDLSNLLQLVYSEALQTTRADCGTILLFDLNRDPGELPKTRFFVGDHPGEGLSETLVKILTFGEPVIIQDTGQHELVLPHEEIASILVVPINYLQRAAGLIILHARTSNRFDQDALEIAASLADQTAVALGNALQYEDQLNRSALLKRELETLGKLFQVAPLMRSDQPLDDVLAALAAAIQDVTPFQAVVISLFNKKSRMLRRAVGLGLSQEAWEELRGHEQPWKGIQQLLLSEYRFGNCYYIPADKTPVVPEDVHTIAVLPTVDVVEIDAWNTDDFLLVPLFDARGEPLGLFSLDAPSDGRRPDRPTFEALELFAAQASLIIESRQKVVNLETRITDLENRHSRLTQAAEHAQKNLPALLHHDLEQTITIQGMHHQMERARAGLEMAELANRQTDALSMLRVLAQELMVRNDLQTAIIAEKDEAGMRLVETVGCQPGGASLEALFGQRNPLSQLLSDRKLILSDNLDGSREWQKNPFLAALGAQSMIGLPVHISETHQMGVLAVGVKRMPAFHEEDDQVFGQLSRQVSVGAQNLELLKETQRRLREVNLLLEFTRKIDILDPEGILCTLVEDALQALPAAQAGWVALWEEKEHALVLQAAAGYTDNACLKGIRFIENEGANLPLPLQAFVKAVPFRRDVNFAQDYSLPPSDLLLYRQATGGRLPVSCLIVPLKRGTRTLGVVLLDNFNTSEAFTAEYEALAFSLAQQTALALESARLFVAADRRAIQLRALTEVAGTITSSLQRSHLITDLLDLFKIVVPYDTATLWLREENNLRVQAASGFADQESRVGLTVSTQDSALFQEMVTNGQPICVPDVRKDERFQDMIEVENFAWLGVPLVAKGELVGAIALEKREADFYTPEHIQAATTFASQAAIGLENARLFEESTRRASELDERSQRLALLNHLAGELSGTLDIERILTITSTQLMQALNGTRVAAILMDGKGDFSVQVEVPTAPDPLPQAWPSVNLLNHLKETQGIFSCANVEAEPELAGLVDLYLTVRKSKAIAVIPMIAATRLHGWLMLQNSEPHRYSSSELELGRTIAYQGANAIQTARLYGETLHLTEDLEKRVEERTAELRREHNNTETLLRIITELSNSLDMEQVMSRALGVLMQSIGSQQGLIYLPQSNRIYQVGKNLATTIAGEMTSIGKEITRWVIRRRVPVLVDDLGSDGRWKVPEDLSPSFSSLIAVPLVLGEEILGALLLISEQPNAFIVEQVSLVEATARQFSITINNAELFNLIRDQAENLGGLLRNQQIESSRSRAILEAVADGVLVTDAQNRLTLCNASAERMLGLKAQDVLNQPLEKFATPFGETSHQWLQTIQKWSKDPGAYQGEVFADRLMVENGAAVAVTLAPVFFRSEFLATVSIFRDITHEVQVERMKSEFISNVSHELRTPMTSIKGYVEVMLMGVTGQLSQQQEHFLKIIKNNTERLNILVNDMLDVSRIEAGRLVLNLQSVDLEKMVKDILAEYQRISKEEERSMNFALHAPSDLPGVKADPARLRQIISNLVNNSYNYTPEDGHVSVRLSLLDGMAQVDVNDDGIGIVEKDQERIFERFFRGEDPLVLQKAGTGLGLAISKILIEMHGGKIWFSSAGKKGEGSTFSFTIPVELREE
jgi:PAS domain S-box-containing protein